LEVLTETKRGANKERWRRVATDRALSLLWAKVIVETEAELKVLRIGAVSTNVYLRGLYNFCVDMNWLPWPIVPKRQWPIVRFQEKRAITWQEHCRIVEREKNPERKAFYQRFAQLALGHNSKAVHRAYARKAQVTLPPLEEYEQKIVPFAADRAVPLTQTVATGA
jgi:hypothetical protein